MNVNIINIPSGIQLYNNSNKTLSVTLYRRGVTRLEQIGTATITPRFAWSSTLAQVYAMIVPTTGQSMPIQLLMNSGNRYIINGSLC